MYIMQSPPGPKTKINGKIVDYFSGCGYFDFQGHPDLIAAACQAVEKYGISSATSPLAYGNNPALLEFETEALDFFKCEKILYYISAIQGSSILLEGLKDRYDIIFVDKESHYSVINATRISGKPVFPFAYRDIENLEKLCKEQVGPKMRPLLICDGIFPVSGDLSPLPEYKDILEKYDNFMICVDDAHATGVIGDNGHGTFEYFGIEGEPFYSSGTLSKALGGHGGIIAGSRSLIDTLNRNATTQYSASTVPIPAIAATTVALKTLKNHPELRQKLWSNVSITKEKLRKIGFEIDNSPVPIICLHSKEKINFQSLQEELFKQDIAVTYLPGGRYTSVPRGGALRLSIFSSHSREQIERLTETIRILI